MNKKTKHIIGIVAISTVSAITVTMMTMTAFGFILIKAIESSDIEDPARIGV